MNDKFKQLALQAKMGTADFDNGSYYVATPDRMQQFAELIVDECLKSCCGKETAKDAFYAIKKQFGDASMKSWS